MTGRARLTLPPSPYVPGQTERPDDALFEPLKSGLGPDLSIAKLAASAAFQAGREAYARGYFWEAHELWEAVWKCLPPAIAERHLLRGLIQLANARLKSRMGQVRASMRIAELADGALREAFLHGQDSLMGLPRSEIEKLRDQAQKSVCD